MTMSTQTLAESARQLAAAILVDTVQVMDVGQPVTTGITVQRSVTAVGQPIPGLVQTVTLENAVESEISTSYSIKVPKGTVLRPGQAVKVVSCVAEPDLAGKILLVGKVSMNGLAMLRKAVATDFENVNQEGKAGL